MGTGASPDGALLFAPHILIASGHVLLLLRLNRFSRRRLSGDNGRCGACGSERLMQLLQLMLLLLHRSAQSSDFGIGSTIGFGKRLGTLLLLEQFLSSSN